MSQISWANNLIIFSHKSTIEEKEFYIRLCIKNNYSKRELERQIASHYYERYILGGLDDAVNIIHHMLIFVFSEDRKQMDIRIMKLCQHC